MPKNIHNIKTFLTGIVSSPDAKDIPEDAAESSLNIDPVSSDGRLQSIGGDDGDPSTNKFYSGPYLIKTLRHKFSYPTRTHTMAMTVVKDGLPFALEPDTQAFQPLT